jgi:tRNA threonylcarbamoyladenosine biosynthesis protein TsaE
MTSEMTYYSRAAAETQALGRRIGELCQPGDLILLEGTLGTGKTCLTQGIAWGLDSDDYAASPSFMLVRELNGRLPLYHADLYRLEDIAEIVDLGFDDYFNGGGVTVIEWAGKGREVLPEENLSVNLSYAGDDARTLEFIAHGARYQELLTALKSKLKPGAAA